MRVRTRAESLMRVSSPMRVRTCAASTVRAARVIAIIAIAGCMATPSPRTRGFGRELDPRDIGDRGADSGATTGKDGGLDSAAITDLSVDSDVEVDFEIDEPIDAPLGRGRGSGGRERLTTNGPGVAEVVAAAYRAAGLDGALQGFARRARLGGLVPAVSVRTGRDARWHEEDPDVGRGTTLEVRATWRLDRLVFDARELQVVALEAARRRERRRLATHVIRTYHVWMRSGSRAAEAQAELDALTDGWFSETKQRSASESRTVGDPPLPRENLPGGPPGSKLP